VAHVEGTICTYLVSPSTDFPAPLCHLLYRLLSIIKSLASCLDREEGFWVCASWLGVGHLMSAPVVTSKKK
jgi:hypothetical protein